MDKASDALAKAASMDISADNANGLKGVRGAIEIRKGQYDEASSSLAGATETTDNLFNKGLAYLLNKDNDSAIGAFGDALALQTDYAMAYYGIAIANARKNDAAKVAACHVYKGDIEIQVELWNHNTGSWPAANLASIGADINYFPEGLPTCPVDGTTYTIDTSTGLVIGHNH